MRVTLLVLATLVLGVAEAEACKVYSASPDIVLYISAPANNSTVCLDATVQCSASATDEDTWRWIDSSTWYVIGDSIASYTWSASGGTFPGGNSGSSVTWHAPNTPGTYMITCTADDPAGCRVYYPDTGCRDDGAKSKSVTINVCSLQLSSSRTWVDYGCGATQNCSFVTCTLHSACPDDQPTFSTTGPLSVQSINKTGDRTYVATVCSTAPSGCEQTGTVKATNSFGCESNTVSITVKQLGPFTFTHTGTDSPVYYYGGVTFSELGEPPPYGCSPDNPVYGCITKVHYELCIECPLPTAKDLFETLQDGLFCNCNPTDAWSTSIPAGYSGCAEVTDSIGVLTCSCDDAIFFGDYWCKSQQAIKIGDCELAQRCIEESRASPAGNCSTLTQTVYVSDGWSGCDCW